LIEDELIEDGRRNTLTESYIRNRFSFDGKLLSQLEQSSLLRKERDGVGRILYEISHDTLVGAIETVAKRRREADEEQKHRLHMAEEEEKQRQLHASLEEEQRKAQYLIGLNKNLSELNRKVGRRTRLGIGLAALMFLFGASAVYGWYLTVERRREKDMAERMFYEYISKVRTQQVNAETYMQSLDTGLAREAAEQGDSIIRVVRSLSSMVGKEELDELAHAVDDQKALAIKLKK
jgi:hypothetical protein